MPSLPNMQRLIDENRLSEAVDALNSFISENPQSDEAYFLRGRAFWRLQNHGKAVSDYERAVAINPDSPARHALDIARDVFDFYNPDLLNP